ncbi:DUF1178 family protein [Tepidicella xavieri]|uniref:DUF1178 family protein n=1 Tax=Tepidicella xavieri TaxID=360241 RepID=A0A4R6UFK4_9BURK|nr:DUF1178 family protein [Tepidicella xavieri]TDQ44009.1 hypothetical protein DFR43_104100 [Tepidicella xavieri]
MKVLDLACAHGHVFEGWFASEDDYLAQRERGLLECPVCGVKDVEKRLTAPRLNLGKGQPPAGPDAAQTTPPSQGPLEAMQAAFLQALQHMVARTEDVGERFADEARRIHHGEAPVRGIRGRASVQEAAELVEEGIDIVPLPDLPLLKKTLQ